MTRARITLSASDETGPAFAAVGGQLDALGQKAAGVVKAFAGVAASMAAVVHTVDQVRTVISGLDQLNDLKDATGASIGNLSALEDVAARTGTSFQTVGTALVKFNAALSNAKVGTEAAEVFKRLGLSVSELKTLDPAEAFRRTAVALAQYSDDGNKARAVQELFGKSLREVAPLLADVARAGALAGKVTEEQAAQAERFNQNLDALAKNSLDAKRALLGDLLPALNQLFDAASGRDPIGFEKLSGAIVVPLQAVTVLAVNVRYVLRGIGTEIGGIAAQAAAVASLDFTGAATIGEAMRADAQAARKEFDLLEERLMSIGKIKAPLADYSNEGRGRTSRSIGDIRKPEVTELDKYLQKLREALLATQNITAVEQARIDINRGLLGILSESSKQQVIGLADALDRIKLRQDSEKAFNALKEEGRKITEGLRTEQERLNDQLDRTQLLTMAGLVGLDTNMRAIDRAFQESFKDINALLEQGRRATEVVLKPVKDLTDRTKELAHSLNDALGESILAAFEGNAKSIDDIWKNLIKRMAAQALQAQLSKALFGDGYGVTTYQMGGAFGGLADWFKSLGGGARASGGPVTAGRPYLVGERGPEVLVPRSGGTIIPNDALATERRGGLTVNVMGDASENTIRLIQAAQAQFEARLLRMGH